MNIESPFANAISLAICHGIVAGPPVGDPLRLYAQIAFLCGPPVKKFWHRSCDVDYGFTHTGNAKRLVAVGIGVWFPPVCNSEALCWAVIPVSDAIGRDLPRWPRAIKPVCLGHLAAWVSENTQPGGGESWQMSVQFKAPKRN